MAKKKNAAPVRAAGKPIDDTYAETYRGGVTINPLAVLKEEITFVDGETNEDYLPDVGTFWFDRPDLNKRFVLTGTFEEEPLGPEEATIFLYAREAGPNPKWLTPEGTQSERPVGLVNGPAPIGEIPMTEAQLNRLIKHGYAVDTSVNPVDFNENPVGIWETTTAGKVAHITVTGDLNIVFAYSTELQ